MSKLFSWKPSDSVDGALLDQQHQALFATVERLYDALRQGNGLAVAGEVFSRLLDYSLNHFAAEEALMEKQRILDSNLTARNIAPSPASCASFKRISRRETRMSSPCCCLTCKIGSKSTCKAADHQYGEFLKAQAASRAQAPGR